MASESQEFWRNGQNSLFSVYVPRDTVATSRLRTPLVGKPLEFDPVSCKITNNDEADRALRPKHWKDWAL